MVSSPALAAGGGRRGPAGLPDRGNLRPHAEHRDKSVNRHDHSGLGPRNAEEGGFLDRLRAYFNPREIVDTLPKVSDEVKTTTCYMCACRCGINVHLKDGGIRYIEGNRDHPVNRGVICGKGASGIMQQQSPAKLRKPLRRVGERGAGEFREIEWDEAIATAVEWLAPIRATDPKKLAFFTGRDQSQSLTGYWAAQFGTPNFAAHGGFCSVNMAAAGMYTLGGSFWEFGEPDWEHTRFLMMFGVAEDHDSNPIKIGLSGLRRRGAKFVSVNPVRPGYSAIADEWVGIQARNRRRPFRAGVDPRAPRGGQDRPRLPGALQQRRMAGGAGPRRRR